MSANTVTLKGHGFRDEALANAAITPGHLVELMSTGKVRVHATAGGNAARMFAVEDDLQGNLITDAYAAADLVQYETFPRGSWVNALLQNGQNASIGSLLESAGDGTLRVHVPDTDVDSSGETTTIYAESIVAVAREAVNMSGSSGEDPSARIAVEII